MQPANLLMVVIDSLRADHLPCYGYNRPTLPWLDRWAPHAVLFDQAYANSGYTPFSHAALFTGMYPSNVPGPKFLGERTRYDVPAGATLAGRLAAKGYRTAAFVNVLWLDPARGLMAGFEHTALFPKQSEATCRAARQWIEAQRGRPWFCFVHLMDVHEPYDPPEPYRSMFDPHYRGWQDLTRHRDHLHMSRLKERDRQHIIALYDGGVRSMNDVLQRCWPQLPGADQGELVTILTADHGDMFGQDNRWGHHTLLWQEVLRVPLVWHCPSRWPARRVDGPVQLVDVTPTLLEVLGLGGTDDCDGMSLSGALLGEPLPADRIMIAELLNEAISQPKRWTFLSKLLGSNWRPRFLRRQVQAIRQGRFRFVHDALRLHEVAHGEGRSLRWRGRLVRRLHQRLIDHKDPANRFLARYDTQRLFDLQTDPGETRNIAARCSEQFHHLRRLLARQTFRGDAVGVQIMEMDAALQAQLRDLGYI